MIKHLKVKLFGINKQVKDYEKKHKFNMTRL